MKPLHVCNFTKHTCGWMNDPNIWKYRWKIFPTYLNNKNYRSKQSALCLTNDSQSNSRDSIEYDAWTFSLNQGKKSNSDVIQARLWSPPIGGSKLKCISLQYQIYLGYVKQKWKIQTPFLSLLRRQEG